MYVADGLEICQLLEKGYFRLNARAGARIQIHHHMPPHCVEIWHKWCRLFMSKKILVPVQLTKITSQSTSVRTPRMPPPSAAALAEQSVRIAQRRVPRGLRRAIVSSSVFGAPLPWFRGRVCCSLPPVLFPSSRHGRPLN